MAMWSKNHILKMRENINTSAETLSDEQALDTPELFPNWEIGAYYETGVRVRYLDSESETDWKLYIGWVYQHSNLSYTALFSYVRLRTGTSWPGTEETTKGVLVGISYLNSDGLYRVRKQFHKASGSWSEIT